MPTKEQFKYVELIAEFIQKDIEHMGECPLTGGWWLCPNTIRCRKLCLDFLGLKSYSPKLRCPCYRLFESAIDRTWQAIVDFDLKRHKWWREGGE